MRVLSERIHPSDDCDGAGNEDVGEGRLDSESVDSPELRRRFTLNDFSLSRQFTLFFFHFFYTIRIFPIFLPVLLPSCPLSPPSQLAPFFVAVSFCKGLFFFFFLRV